MKVKKKANRKLKELTKRFTAAVLCAVSVLSQITNPFTAITVKADIGDAPKPFAYMSGEVNPQEIGKGIKAIGFNNETPYIDEGVYSQHPGGGDGKYTSTYVGSFAIQYYDGSFYPDNAIIDNDVLEANDNYLIKSAVTNYRNLRSVTMCVEPDDNTPFRAAVHFDTDGVSQPREDSYNITTVVTANHYDDEGDHEEEFVTLKNPDKYSYLPGRNDEGIYEHCQEVEGGLSFMNLLCRKVFIGNQYATSVDAESVHFYDSSSILTKAAYWSLMGETSGIRTETSIAQDLANSISSDSGGAKTAMFNFAHYGCNALAKYGDSILSMDSLPGNYDTAVLQFIKLCANSTIPSNVYTVSVATDYGQSFIGLFTAESPKLPVLQLKKASGNTAVTDGNPCYNLAGAVYKVYADVALTKEVGTLTTDANGNTNTLDLSTIPEGDRPENGIYYIKEVTAPKGYRLDPYKYPVATTVKSTQGNVTYSKTDDVETYTLNTTDIPMYDPVSITLYKKDSQLNADKQGDASVDGAIYKMDYYPLEAAFNGTKYEVPNSAVKNTWYFKTANGGKIELDGPGNPANNYVVNDAEFTSSAFYMHEGLITWPLGTYVIREVKAPENYFVSDEVFVAVVVTDATNKVVVKGDINISVGQDATEEGKVAMGETAKRYPIYFTKTDNNYDSYRNQGDANLPKKFVIMNNSENPVSVDKNGDGSFTADETCATIKGSSLTDDAIFEKVKACNNTTVDSLVIDIDGDGNNDVIAVVTADANGLCSFDGLVAGTYRVFELPIYGYKVMAKDVIAKEGNTSLAPEKIENEIVRGGVEVKKKDITSDTTPLYDLSDIEFTIYNKSAESVKVDTNGDGTMEEYAVDTAIMTITTEKNADGTYSATTGSNVLPYGTYLIKETKSNSYYALSNWERTFRVRTDGKIETTDVDGNNLICNNAPIRPDFKLEKIGEMGEKLAYVPFLVTNTDTGEQHILVTNANGVIDTKATVKTMNTNTNDKWLTDIDDIRAGKKLLKAEDFDMTAGVWFGEGTVIDGTGSLYAGNYSYEELPCANNRGRILFSDTFEVGDSNLNNGYIDLGTIKNMDTTPNIATTALDEITKAHVASVGILQINDTCHLTNLTPGREYEIRGSLMIYSDTGTQLMIDGNPVTKTVTFTADNEEMDVVVPFDRINTADIEGKTVVVFEELYKNGVQVAFHTDILDEDQSVMVPKIGTTAITENGNHYGSQKGITKIIDTVMYEGLNPKYEYTVSGVLMDKETNKPLLDKDGKEITATKKFTPSTAEGSIDLVYEFDAELVQGHAVVVFEDMYYKGIKVAVHANINDALQTVYYPDFQTIVRDSNISITNMASSTNSYKFADEVIYEGLEEGATYIMRGTLMNLDGTEFKASPKPGMEKETVKAEKKFKPVTSNGTVDVDFEFYVADIKELEGVSLVVFEELYVVEDSGNELHLVDGKKIDDANETINIPKIGTSAADGKTKDHIGTVEKEATIIDTVNYENLIVGKEYTVSGILMDKETNKPVLDKNGKEITATKNFTATEKAGSVDLEYKLDSTLLEGKSVVVFEDLYYEGIKLVSHADINDDSQTVYYANIDTYAHDEDGRKYDLMVSSQATIIDTVSYNGLIPGKQYKLVATMQNKDGSGQVTVNGEPLIAIREFTPETPDGTVDVTFSFNAVGFEGQTFVIFETLYYDDKEIIIHADLEDKDQTISFEKVDIVDTGDSTPIKSLIFTMLLSIVVMITLVTASPTPVKSRRRRK